MIIQNEKGMQKLLESNTTSDEARKEYLQGRDLAEKLRIEISLDLFVG